MAYFTHILILVNIYIILSVATGLIVGMSRMISLGQAAFYGIGAYVTALAVMVLDLTLIPSLLLVMVVNAAVGLMLALPAVRLKGDYFILATLAFQFIIFSLMNNLDITNGSLGIGGIGPVSVMGIMILDSPADYLLLSLVMAAVVVLVFYLIYHSSFGNALRAMREDEVSLQTQGRNTSRLKITAFIVSGAFIGWASFIFASYMTYIFPGGFHLDESIFILIAVIVGGSGTIRGGIAGALFVVVVPELIRYSGLPDSIAAPMNQLLFGMILILVMFYRPYGLLGKLKL